uniref:phage tail spike protein n=1 Tax=Bacteroides sp. TaxID=29523 RepID=UPI00261E1DDE
MLYIFNPSETLLETIPDSFFDIAKHHEVLNDDNYFHFTVINPDYMPFLVVGNLVAFIDLDGYFQFFEILNVRDVDGAEFCKYIYCEHILFELLDDFVTDKRPSAGATAALTGVLENTRWNVGIVDEEALGVSNCTIYYESALAGVKKIAQAWGGELRWRCVINDGIITRYCDLLAQRGADNGKVFTCEKDIVEIERTEDISQLCTALYGVGKGVETDTGGFGRRLNFSDVVWSVASGDPVDKPAGQEWVGDAGALVAYGRNGRHRFDIYIEDAQTDGAALLQNTWDVLQIRKTPRVTYKMKVSLFERLTGSETVRLGDYVGCLDFNFNPVLAISARVMDFERDIKNYEESVVVLGNFAPTLIDFDFSTHQQVTRVINRTYNTNLLDGTIDVLQNAIENSQAFVFETPQGTLHLNAATYEEATEAMLLGGGRFAIANQKDGEGGWEWRTFGDGSGFTLDLLTAGKIRADQVQIGSVSTFASGYDPSTKETPSGAQSKATAAQQAAEVYAGGLASNLQDQIDGNIIAWFYEYEPTLIDEPTVSWDTDAKKNQHLNDTFTNTITGYSYRWAYVTGVYQWIRITDTDVTKALEDARKAQDIADHKRRVFVATPTNADAYDIGDLWSGGSSGDLKRCKTVKIAGAVYDPAHWELASKYTDDTTAISKAKTFCQAGVPTSVSVGDFWIDSDDGNKLYRAACVGANEIKAGEWILVRDAGIAQALEDAATAITDAATAQGTADGKVTTFFQTAVPTAEGVGDLWIDTDDGNKLYRWNGSTWTAVQDAGIAQAITAAGTAQTTANSKIVTFYQTSMPTASAVGDLWVDTDDNNKLYRWSGSAWQTARDATIATAQTTANNAATAASNAQTSANTANTLLSDIANDNKLTPVEKQATKKEWDVIVSEKSGTDTQADVFSVSRTVYDSAYDALNTYITPLLSNLTTTSDITGTTFRTNFKNYYDARTALLNAIAAKAKEIADSKLATGVGVDSDCSLLAHFDDSLLTHKADELSFVRESIAIKQDGSQVAANIPRYETGKFGKAIMVEEGTPNLLSANQSSVETNTTGFTSNNGAVLTRDITKYWTGNASLKVVSTGGTYQGFCVTASVTTGLVYTFSVYLYSDAQANISVTLSDTRTRADISITLNAGIWTRFSFPFPITMTSSGTFLMFVRNTAAGTFYADGLQLEQKSYATSWILGGTTRQPELLSFPTTGLSPTTGTISVWVNVNTISKRQITTDWPMIFCCNKSGGISLRVGHNNNTTQWYIWAESSSGGFCPDSLTPNGWHMFTATWNASYMKLYIDGTEVISVSNPQLPLDILSIDLGYSSTVTLSYADTLFDELRIDSVARTADEIKSWYNARSPFYAAESLDNFVNIVINPAIDNAMSAAANAQEAADGLIQGFFQTTAPTSGMSFGDIWIDTDGHTPPTTADIYRYEDVDHGSQGILAWRATPTSAVGAVYLSAYNAQTTANSKIKTWYQASAPTSGRTLGDLWVDTDDGNKLYRWDNSNWVQVRDAGIAIALDGTAKYRTDDVPANNPLPSAIVIESNTDGSINIKLSWGQYTQDGTKQADLLLLFWKKGDSSGLGAPGVTDSCIAFNVNTAGASFYRFEGVPSDKYYSFGIAAARRTESGLRIGAIQSPTSSPDWQDVTQGTPNYTGDVAGTPAGEMVNFGMGVNDTCIALLHFNSSLNTHKAAAINFSRASEAYCS